MQRDMSANKHFDNLDITRDEFEKIKAALEKEEFRKLFLDYCEEIQDPENRRQYEREIKQLEAERGVDVTFLNPEPGFVVKTSVNGKLKCFVNIAKCSNVAEPKKELCTNRKNGIKGFNWSIPHGIPPPRDDFDNKGALCKVFDVLFNPNALDLAEQNQKFRQCLIDTACDGIEREYKVQLDRSNLRFPKLKFKGVQRPSVIRKISENPPPPQEEFSVIDKIYPPRPIANERKKDVECIWETKREEYCKPAYVIKHRRPIEMSEMTYELDAKMNITLPKELVVEVELPLLKSTANCTLDVTEKMIYIVSEKPAKYKLNVELPYEVNDKDGTAKFDLNKRQLIITLPVKKIGKERSIKDLYKEDSGVESDLREEMHSSGAYSPVTEIVEVQKDNEINKGEPESKTTFITCNSADHFLKESIQYVCPHFDCNVLDEVIAIILHVRNVESTSIELIKDEKYFHVQFTSIGAGYYPIYYAFYFEFPQNTDIRIESIEPEAWDNNIVLTLNLQNIQNFETYYAGLDKTDTKLFKIQEKFITNTANLFKPHNQTSQLEISVERPDNENSVEIEIKTKNFIDLNLQNIDNSTNEKYLDQTNKKIKKKNKKRRSFSESACDDIKQFQQKEANSSFRNINQKKKDKNRNQEKDSDNSSKEIIDLLPKHVRSNEGSSIQTRFPRKQRSFSESRENITPTFKGILKHYSRYAHTISDSCSSIDEPSSYSCSVDGGLRFAQSFSDIPEENSPPQYLSEGCKKTVRFNEVIKKQVFRLDSSILGQRKKNQKKKNKKQRALQRRHSEGDSADYEDNKSPCNEHQFLTDRVTGNSGPSTEVDGLTQEKTVDRISKNYHNTSELSDTESKNLLIFDIDI